MIRELRDRLRAAARNALARPKPLGPLRIVITGAARGIGLELARQLVQQGHLVEATVRDLERATALREVAAKHDSRLKIHVCNVTDPAQVAALAIALGAEPLDVLINNAGIAGDTGKPFVALEPSAIEQALLVNTIAPVRVTQALLPMLRRSRNRPRVINMSTDMACLTFAAPGQAIAYRTSKTALNMATRASAPELARDGVIMVAVHPGWLKTDMGGAEAPTPVASGVARLITLMHRIDGHHSGAFIDCEARQMPW